MPDLELEPSERSEWSELAFRNGSIYATPEWLETWWRHFGRGRRLSLVRCRDGDGRLVAVLPLYRWSSFPLRVLRLLGHGPSDALGALCAPEGRPAAAAALRELLESERVDAFVGEEMPQSEGWAEILGGRVLRRRPSPVLHTEGRSWDEFVASRSRRTRQQIGRDERRLAESGLAYRITNDAGVLERDLDSFFALHAARFPGKTSQLSSDPRFQAFHRDFARQAFERGWLRLWFLEKDGVAVSVEYVFAFAGSHYSYNGGWLPEWGHLSVGRALIRHTMKRAFDEGASEFRFLRGAEDYKYWSANEDRPVDTIAVTRGVLPRAALASYYAVWQLRRKIAGRHLRSIRQS